MNKHFTNLTGVLQHTAKRALSVAAVAACSLASFHAKAQFTQGNVVVLQVGDGSAALGNGSTAIFLKEYNTTTATQASPVSTVNVPTTGANRLTIGGSSTAEGFMSLSGDSTKIVIPGYDTTTGIASIAGTTSANINRAIDTVNVSGVVGRAVSSSTAYSGASFRSATKSGASNYWGSGAATGSYYFGTTATAATIQTTITNGRVINTFNGNLYISSGAAATLGLYKVTGLPTTAGTTGVATQLIATGTGSSPYGFAINSAETVVYIADDRAAASGGGIQKWVYTAGSWGTAPAYTLATGGTSGARSLIADFSGTNATIYATTTDNKLIKIVDSNSTAALTTLATAGNNTAFRSVVFAPKTACTAPSLSTAVTNISCSSNGAVNLTVTGGSAVSSYSWTGPSSFTASTQNITGLTAAGTYNVTVTTTGGCTATTSATVANNSSLTATITAGGATTLCQGDSVLLSANTGTGYTYQWKLGTGTISGATNATYKAGATGSYTVVITNGGCNATSNAIAVTVNPLPVAVFTPGNTDICEGNTAILQATTATGNTYQWNLGGNPISGATNSVYMTGTGGSYTLTVTNNGCSATSTAAVITTHALPDTTITATGATTFCDGDSVMLKATSGVVYQWFKDGQLIPGATDSTYTVTSGGDYKVAIINASACVDTSMTTTVTVNPLPVPVITNTNDTLSTTTFTTYQWYLDGVAISGATNQTWVPTANGNYTVFVTDGNTCGDTSGVITLTHVSIVDPGAVAIGIYPNPVHDVLVIAAPMPVNVLVKDMQGRTVQQVNNAQRISMGNLPDGLYFLTVADSKTGRIVKTEKISKQNR